MDLAGQQLTACLPAPGDDPMHCVSDYLRPHKTRKVERAFASFACGALSVPRKNRLLPLVAAPKTALLCSSRFSTGRQNACG